MSWLRQRPGSRGRRLWRWVQGAIGAAVVIVLVESFVTLGLVVPVRVEGSSMSPTFAGAHADLECPRCQWSFEVGVDQLPLGRPVVCPDCRIEFPLDQNLQTDPGQRLVISRTRHAGQAPRRWEVVVVRNPQEPGSLCVKRIVGLPAETLAFRDGDLVVDGQIVRKSLEEQLELRQLVHRERAALRLWQPEGGGWRWTGDAWRATTSRPTRLEFRPLAGTPITDDLATNQRAMRRPRVVADVMLSCRVTASRDSQLVASCRWDDLACETSPIDLPADGRGRALVVSWFDKQLLVALDGEVLQQRPCAEPWSGAPAIELEMRGEATLAQLEVWRDIHYHLRPGDQLPRGELPAGHYFVVGDNVAISADCRNWPAAGIPFENLVGGIVGH